MYRQPEEQPPWGQGQPQGHQQPQGLQQWQQSPMHGGQQTPQYYQQSSAPQQYMPGNPQGGEQAWSQNGQPQQAPFQQSASMYAPAPQPSPADASWQNAPQQQQGGQGWQGVPQGQYMGQGGPQQQPATLPDNRRSWIGAVTQLIPPNYGIVDGNAFYVEPVVVGQVPGVGDRVACEAVPNTDGGKYEWRVLRVEMVQPTALTRMPPNQAQQTRPFAIPHNRPGVPGQVRESPARTSPTRSPAYNASPAHQPSAVPSKPLGVFAREPVKQEAPAAAPEPVKYNQMAPPMTAYTAEYALAKASAAMDGNRQQAAPAPQPDRRPFFSGQAKELDEEALRRSAAAAQQLGSAIGDPASIGAKLMSKMGFGIAGQGLGRAGQGIVAPVEAIKMGQGQGLGFAPKQRNRSPDRDRPARRRGPREERPRARTPPRRRPRSRSASPRSRSRSPDAEFRGRYRVEPPKFAPWERERGVAALSKRYRNLYIPADFCHVSATWVDSLPEWDPLPLTHHVSMKIAKAEKHSGDLASEGPEDKMEASLEEQAVGDIATDALTPGKRWSARVVLMSGVNARLLHNSSVKVFQHPLKKLQFLTGRKGRSELLLIGGAWDPMDGADPANSPSALIATAARAFKAATGVDLSAAVHWTKFAHLRYLRKNDLEDDIEENVVVYLVDAHELAVPDQEAKDVLAKAASAATTEIEAKKALDAAEEEVKSAEANFHLLGSRDVPPPPDIGDNLTITPTEMTVAALQEALSKRGLDTKWNPLKSKKELVDRLQEYVDTKRKEHAALDKDFKAYEDAKKALEAAKQKSSEAKEAVKGARAAVLEALKTVSDPPATEMLQIQPNKDFLGGRESFHTEVSSLDALLGYTEKDDREGMFEVSVFAELFREMLEARFGCGILRALEVLEQEDRRARAKKAEERRAKKEAEAAAKAKASIERAVEGSTKAAADIEADNTTAGADGSSAAAAKAAPEQAGADKQAEAGVQGADGSPATVTAAPEQAAKPDKAAGKPAANKEGETPPAAVEEGHAKEVAVAPAEAGEATDVKASPPATELATENGDIVMAEAKLEAETILEVAKEEGVQNSDTAAAAAPPGKVDARAGSGATVSGDAKMDKPAALAAAPASEEAPAKAIGSPTALLDAEIEAGKPGAKAKAVDQSSEKEEGIEKDRQEAGEKSDKAPKKDSKDAKEDKATSKSKKKDEKPKEKERDREKERERTKADTRDKVRSRDDRGRSSKEEPPGKRARSDRDRDPSLKRKEDSSRKGDSRAAENGHRTRGKEKTKADDSKKAEKAEDSKKPDKDGASAKQGDSKKRASAVQPEPEAKKRKTERQPEGSKPSGTPTDQSTAGGRPSKAEQGSGKAAACAPPPVADTAPAAAAESANPPAAKSRLASADSAAPAREQLAAQSASQAAAEAPQLEALPPPQPRWQAQPTPFLLACRFFDRDLAGYIEAVDLEEILVMVSDNVSRRRLQNLVDSVVKRSKMSYMEQYASLEVPAVLPPDRAQQAAADHAHSGAAVHSGSLAVVSGQSLQLAKDMELSMLHRKLTALAKSEAGLRKMVSTMEGEKSALEKDRVSLDKKRAQEVAQLNEKLSAAQAAARRDAEAATAKSDRSAAKISRTLEDISAAEKGLVAAKEKLHAISAQAAAHSAVQPDQQPT